MPLSRHLTPRRIKQLVRRYGFSKLLSDPNVTYVVQDLPDRLVIIFIAQGDEDDGYVQTVGGGLLRPRARFTTLHELELATVYSLLRPLTSEVT